MNEKSEQIDLSINFLLDDDQPLKGEKLFSALVDVLPGAQVKKRQIDGKDIQLVSYISPSGADHVFFLAAITFLGGVGCHPVFKKRIQLKNYFKRGYEILVSEGKVVHFLGVYHYCGNIVFTDFETTGYLKNKMNNSSAFVYTNDLYRAMKDGVAFRKDFNGHLITTVKKVCMKAYVDGITSLDKKSDQPLFDSFGAFNHIFPFGKWLNGKDAIVEMKNIPNSEWRQCEWPGWYLEFLFERFVKQTRNHFVVYQGRAKKKKEDLDFDLIFPIHNFLGDLKASDIYKKDCPGNDAENFAKAISKFDRFWYVIYEHETIKDKDIPDFSNSVTKFRHELLISEDGVKMHKNEKSYYGRMKNSVRFTKMLILEINRANSHDLLKEFNQGRQPDGKKRKQKYLIPKHKQENYQVFHFELDK